MIIIWLFIWGVVIGTSIWVFTDAKARILTGERLEPIESPAGWAWGCILLWIVFFPWYLMRKSNSNVTTKPTLTRIVEQVTSPLSVNTQMPASIADELLKFNELKEKGVISQEDFEAQRQRLLGSSSKTSEPTPTAKTENLSPETGVVNCKTCNAELSDQAVFCGDCGSKVDGANDNV
jgi:Short C-terminal domain